MPEYRLGDDIDDYCVRCKRLTNHLVVSVMYAEPAKVRCRTCHSDHDYRREQPPPPKVDLRKAALFNEVLKKVDPGAAPVVVPPVEPAVEAVVEPAVEPVVEPIVEEPPAPTPKAKPEPKPKPKAQPKPKPKPKTKGKART
jgi:outer membrane biosynthesis protein TonB